MKRKLIKNSSFGIVQVLVNVLLVFITIPIFIKILGSQSYGVFSLVMVVGNLNILTNLGITNALVKFIAEQGRSNQSNVDIVVSLVILISILFPTTVIFIVFRADILLYILKVPSELLLISEGLFFWILISNFFIMVGQVFKSILDAIQMIYITSLVQSLYNFLYWGLIILVILLGYDLSIVGMAIFIASIVWFIVIIIITIKAWGRISFVVLKEDFWVSFKKQINYGSKIYFSGLIGFLYEPVSKILISNFIGINEVGFYDIALKIRNQLWSLFAKVFYPLYPFISEQKDIKVVKKYIHDLEQKSFLILIPVSIIIIFLTYPFIELWIGENVSIISITVIIIVSFHLLFSSTVIPNYQFLLAKNLAHKTILIQLSNVVFNAVFFLGTVRFLGYYSVVISNVAGIVSSFVLSIYYQKKYLDSLIFNSYSHMFRVALYSVIMFISSTIIILIFSKSSVILFVLIPVVIILQSLLLLRVLRLVNRTDIIRYFGDSNRIAILLIKFF